MTLNYLAYGSNLHPLRLSERAPSARLVGTAALPDRTVEFCKRSVDGSGKCTLLRAGSDSVAFGAVFRIAGADRPALDRAEGLGAGYRLQRRTLVVGGRELSVFCYVAMPEYVDRALRPYRWYKDLVLAGARYHGFPPEWIAHLETVPAMKDPDARRRAAGERLVRRCRAAPLP